MRAVNRDRFLILVGALSACHAQERTEVTLPALPSTTPPPPTPESFCDSLARKNEAVIANPAGPRELKKQRVATCGEESDNYARASFTDPAKRPKFLSYCHAAQGGTWAVMIMSISLDDPGGEAPPCGWQATYKLVHVRGGVIATSDPIEYTRWSNDSDEYEVTRVVDLDHDGQDELVLTETPWHNGECVGMGEDCEREGPSERRWTAAGDKVTVFKAR